MDRRSNEERLVIPGEPEKEIKTALSAPVDPPAKAPQTLNFITPTEFVELPSRGSYYPQGHPLHEQEVVEIKHMTTKEEDILTSTALLKSGLAIERMLENIIVNKNIRSDDLLLGDKNALIIAARTHGYGASYNTTVTCPACKENQSYDFDLSSLEIRRPSEDFMKERGIVETENNTFLVPLKASEYTVEVRLLTGYDEKQISKLSEHKRKRNFPESPITDFLRALIVSVNGITDSNSLNGFINSLPAIQARYLRQTYEKLVPTLDLNHDFACNACSQTALLEVPLTADFFWSNS